MLKCLASPEPQQMENLKPLPFFPIPQHASWPSFGQMCPELLCLLIASLEPNIGFVVMKHFMHLHRKQDQPFGSDHQLPS